MEIRQEQVRIPVSETLGNVSGVYTIPSEMKALFTLAHGAGTDYNHHFLITLSDQLASAGIGTLRFNFPYTEKGRKMPDRFPTAASTILAVIAQVKHYYNDVPLFCSGKSFGGRMSSQTLAKNPEMMQSVNGIVFFGFPLHPANTPSVERAEHLAELTLPILFLQGTKDTLAYMDLIRQVQHGLPHSVLIEIENADHSFQIGKKSATDALVTHTSQWVDTLLKR